MGEDNSDPLPAWGDLLPATEERESFWGTIKGEIPALCHHLLHYQIPEAKRHPRYGITHYHNPELLVALDALSPEVRLHDLIQETLFDNSNTPYWNGTATDLESELFDKHKGGPLRDISPNASATGKYLNRLEEKMDEPHIHLEITFNRKKNRRLYQITPRHG